MKSAIRNLTIPQLIVFGTMVIATLFLLPRIIAVVLNVIVVIMIICAVGLASSAILTLLGFHPCIVQLLKWQQCKSSPAINNDIQDEI